MPKIIGIITRPDLNATGKDVSIIYDRVRESILKAGGVPIGIVPPSELIQKKLSDGEVQTLYQTLDLCDGYICQGGDDFYDYDQWVVRYCYEKDKPLLGICLGMQNIACFFGGTLVRNETGVEHMLPDQEYAHFVELDSMSKLADIFQTTKLKVNSFHHEMIVKQSIPKCNIVGYSDDGIVEAVEVENKKFIIGVQWHPERLPEQLCLFEALIAGTKE